MLHVHCDISHAAVFILNYIIIKCNSYVGLTIFFLYFFKLYNCMLCGLHSEINKSYLIFTLSYNSFKNVDFLYT